MKPEVILGSIWKPNPGAHTLAQTIRVSHWNRNAPHLLVAFTEGGSRVSIHPDWLIKNYVQAVSS